MKVKAGTKLIKVILVDGQEIGFLDIKKGDRFRLYEPTGELVEPKPSHVWESQEDAYLENGVPTVRCEPRKDMNKDMSSDIVVSTAETILMPAGSSVVWVRLAPAPPLRTTCSTDFVDL